MNEIDNAILADAEVWRAEIATAYGEHRHMPRVARSASHRTAMLAGAAVVLTLVAVVWAVTKVHRPAGQSSGSYSLPSGTPDDGSSYPDLSRAPKLQLRMVSAFRARKMISLPWVVINRDSNVGTITIGFANGDGTCVKATSVSVAVEGKDLVVEVLGSKFAAPSAACPSRVSLGQTTLAIGPELTGRRLVHGVVDADWTKVGFP